MRPRLLSVRNFALLLVALGIFGGLAYWIHGGMALPGAAVPSTAGKLAFISDRNGHSDLFMMNGADGGSLTALTNDAPDDREPAWSMDGSLLGFVSQNRVGAGAQIFEMNAEPGARVVPLTHTSSAKEAPAFAVGGRVFYLGGGTLGSTTSDGTDTDLVFPSADELKALQGTEDQPGILSMGGVSRAIPSPDGVRIAATLKTDHGAALVLYNSETKLCTLIGIGERIFSGFAADGKLIAFFDNGSPLREPQPLFNADSIKAGMAAPATAIDMQPPAQKLVATFDLNGTPGAVHPLPFSPECVAFAPDGTRVAFGLARSQKTTAGQPPAGILIASLADGHAVSVFNGPVTEISFSPDGSRIAFVSGSDIFAAKTDGSAPSSNLTQGKGRNSAPVWSPARPRS
jgi:dipeptidyl aminopeptidase/acylaminoacyl peptidase